MLMDRVHDTQEVFRMTLDCMAKPGVIQEMVYVSEQPVHCSPALFLQAITLLDGEVTFHIIGQNSSFIENYFSSITFSKVAPIEEANYLFILKDVDAETIQMVIQKANIGTLENPHQSATILLEVTRLSNDQQLKLTGPGIQEMNFVQITESDQWILQRAKRNQAYPLGLDFILIDEDARLMCIPRTTRIEKMEVM